MRIKFKGIYSQQRSFNGGRPHGCLLGNLEYLAKSSNSADMVSEEKRVKFKDDLTVVNS